MREGGSGSEGWSGSEGVGVREKVREEECLMQSICGIDSCLAILFPKLHFHSCVTGNCWTLRNFSTLRVRVTARYEEGVAIYECVNESYTLKGPSTRQCLSNGN